VRIAILGGRGVVGGFLTPSLSSNHEVTPITRDTFDLSDYHAMSDHFNKNPYDVVINTAINPDSQMTASTQVATDNLTIFTNMYACRNSFGRVLQFCSGAEFDRRQSLDSTTEDSLFTHKPIDPYGLSKNACAKISYTTENFYNIRLFGVFYPTEAARRLLPKILLNHQVHLEDKYFDYLYLEDLLPVVEYYIDNTTPRFKDINVVYPEKTLLSDFVKTFCKLHDLSGDNITYGERSELNYTGDSTRFDSLDLQRLGSIVGMKKYR
jgi:GDP-L-fucose synthase